MAAIIRVFIAILSALFTDLPERGITAGNPTRNLPCSTMRLMRPTHDPRTTPFIEKLDDVRRIYVRESVKGPLKNNDSRVVPILDRLVPVLQEWKLRNGGKGPLIPARRSDGGKIDKHTPGTYLRETLDHLGLTRPGLRWYQVTRHTFASQWVLAGGSIEKLGEILGHYSVVMTERYAHLRPDLFSARDLATIDLDLNASEPDPRPTDPENGHKMASPRQILGRIMLKPLHKCRSRPVSRVGVWVSRPVNAKAPNVDRSTRWQRRHTPRHDGLGRDKPAVGQHES